MALILIHKIMIATATVFCALFALRCWMVNEPQLCVGFTLATIALAVYFLWFLRTKSAPESGSRLDDTQASSD